MKLYNFPWGPYPRRVELYLGEKAIKGLELVEVEFPHQPELWPEGFLKALNPAHSLPVLDTEKGPMIGQSIAILEYLEELYPTPDLIGSTAEARAATREWIAIFDEAASFFGLWARQGSAVNADRHRPSLEAALAGAERYASKLRIAEEKFVGPFLAGDVLSMADCVAMALIEFTDQFYGVPLPKDCPKLMSWYALMSERPTVSRPAYPEAMLQVAHGLPEQTDCFI
ncbi:glutathione S-transferase family protein [Sinorhizobium numidicum]|uniref:Glutathione S-transferase family protein n=1 Tax=Sinorhizobium numidicum TaxID=680248 RepID=A0ABY8CSJ2_9HYPH|nr:glutathione S-transferase family protein [Sinorhizobium numidicum]WEX75148.1 glutathione S-transferase family protein [Sinorhizobium numidicum]WEX81142.1 glutathione S-transferase family protein [Sinorhizobium numidicum]